jgi:hypothetical protein
MYVYVQAFLEQVLVSVAGNGAHNLKQRLARWLLMMRDRGDDDTLQITQNLLAEMLGAQRPTITNAARELERAEFDCARPTASRDTRSAGPRGGILRMLSVGPGAPHLSSSQNIRVKSEPLTESVIYIADNIPQRAHNQD